MNSRITIPHIHGPEVRPAHSTLEQRSAAVDVLALCVHGSSLLTTRAMSSPNYREFWLLSVTKECVNTPRTPLAGRRQSARTNPVVGSIKDIPGGVDPS